MKECAKEEWFLQHLKRIQEIAEIDIKAAYYIRSIAPETLEVFNYGQPLHCMFSWKNTPQGFRYWRQINIALGDFSYGSV